MAELRETSCGFCGKIILTRRDWHRFCGKKCHDNYHRKGREYLSITAAAGELGVCRQTLSRAIRMGRICPVEIATRGRPHRFITRAELERYRKEA
jgi:hypothetical protein